MTTLRTYLTTLRDYQRLAYRLMLQQLLEENTRFTSHSRLTLILDKHKRPVYIIGKYNHCIYQ